jgi:hypothetical protein
MNSQKFGLEGTYLRLIKAILNKAMPNIIWNKESWPISLLDMEKRQRGSISSLLLDIVLEVLAKS